MATKNGGPSESLADDRDECGVLVDPTDPLDIARGLMALAGDAGAWEETRNAGMRRVAERYTWDRTAEAYHRVFEELRRGGGKSDDDFPVPGWFTDPTEDDIGRDWLSSLYFD